MPTSDKRAAALSPPQRAALLELGSRGSGGEFDFRVMCQLMTAGLVDIRSRDRRIVLTEEGQRTFIALTGSESIHD